MGGYESWALKMQIRLSFYKLKEIELRRLLLGVFVLFGMLSALWIYFYPRNAFALFFGSINLAFSTYTTFVWLKVWNRASEYLRRAKISETYASYKPDVLNFRPDFDNIPK